MLTKDHAICIRTVDYSETSQVVTLFTKKSGKISAIAKGSKRAKSNFGGPIELFAFGEIMFKPAGDNKLCSLTEFEQKQTFSGLSKNLFAMNCCLFALELINSLTDEFDPHEELFYHFLEFLRNIETSTDRKNSLALLVIFQLTLLGDIGLQPVLKNCVNCKNKFTDKWLHVYFSSAANGLICRDCEAHFVDKIKLSEHAAKCLFNFANFAAAHEKTLEEIEKILIHHFTEMLHRRPKMAKHILK